MILEVKPVVYVFLSIASASSFVYVCERDEVTYESNMVLVAPGKTNNPGRVEANCTIRVDTQPGVRLQIKVYRQFSVSTCGLDFVKIYDGISSVTKCGSIPHDELMFTSASNYLTVWYKSSSHRDQVALSFHDFGCPYSRIVSGDNYKISKEPFVASQASYKIDINCEKGYLINGTNTTSVGAVCEYKRRYQIYKWQTDYEYACQIISCKRPLAPLNGQLNVSSLTLGSAVAYVCSEGYDLIGVGIGYCFLTSNNSAEWNTLSPTCQAKDCGSPMIANANYSLPNNTYYKSSFLYFCPSDQQNYTAECNRFGYWNFTRCPLPNATEPERYKYTTLIIVSSCVAAILFITFVVVVMAIFIIRRRQKRTSYDDFSYLGPGANYLSTNPDQTDNGQMSLEYCRDQIDSIIGLGRHTNTAQTGYAGKQQLDYRLTSLGRDRTTDVSRSPEKSRSHFSFLYD